MSVSAHGDRKHCSSITTARRKKTPFPLNEACMSPARHYLLCARDRQRDVADGFRRHARATQPKNFDKCAKHRFHKGFCYINISARRWLYAAARTCRAAPKWLRRAGSKARNRRLKKKIGKLARASVSVRRIRRESRESVASDSRSTSFAMTFWRRCGEIATTFFAKTDDRGPTKIARAKDRRHLFRASAARPAPSRRVKCRACA